MTSSVARAWQLINRVIDLTTHYNEHYHIWSALVYENKPDRPTCLRLVGGKKVNALFEIKWIQWSYKKFDIFIEQTARSYLHIILIRITVCDTTGNTFKDNNKYEILPMWNHAPSIYHIHILLILYKSQLNCPLYSLEMNYPILHGYNACQMHMFARVCVSRHTWRTVNQKLHY